MWDVDWCGVCGVSWCGVCTCNNGVHWCGVCTCKGVVCTVWGVYMYGCALVWVCTGMGVHWYGVCTCTLVCVCVISQCMYMIQFKYSVNL